MLQLQAHDVTIVKPDQKELWDIIVDQERLTPFNSPLVLAILYRACGTPSSNNNKNLGQKEKDMYNLLIQGDKEMLPIV